MSSKIDSRELIKSKFLKKTRTFVVNSTPDIDYIDEPIIDLYDVQSQPSVGEPLYDYLVDDPLSKEYNEDEIQNNNIFICMYKKNTGLVLPYVTYYLIETANILQFPNLNFTEPGEDDSDDDNNNDDVIQPQDVHLESDEENTDNMNSGENINDEEKPAISGGVDDILFNQCSQYIQNISEKGSNLSYEQYKGFIKSEEEDIYCFLDITDIIINDENLPQFTSCIIDEIVRSNQRKGLPIIDNINKMFKNETIIRHLVDQNDVLIHNPIIVYLCENINDEIVNSVYETENSQTVSLVGDETEHPIVGNGYLFTSSIIDETVVSRAKRFALFHYDAVYVLHEPFIESEYELVSDESCVSFLSDGKEYWSTNNISLFNEL